MQKKEVQQPETEQNKRHYEKPSLSAVRLFADMVLQVCGNDTCGPPYPDMSPS
ncbi:MAG: hypothetical protein CDV28_1393 [Candidatus Electronema aureum]|uniref:Uncharacterized protein n=1 Tax=Candidatus Electronema aureum TaxID=2005002 RepID=A0A521FZB5_9BACT|nr:MAG: hypothetical protein CDV28_1393 [Candidatus Electronema aureum]